VSFLRRYEKPDATLPDIRSPRVAAYVARTCAERPGARRHVEAALRFLLELQPSRRLTPARKQTTQLFDELVPGYIAFARQHRGWRTSWTVEFALRQFFEWLAARKIRRAAEITPSVVRDYLASRQDLARSSLALHAASLRGFFRYLVMKGTAPAHLAMLVESPRLYRMSKPPTVLDAATIERLLSAVDRSTPLGKRNFAILLLAARYGLRPSDIKKLRLDDVRWRDHRIAIVQSKTQRPLELPLVPDVDRALVDYLRNGRPACQVRQIFVRHRAPYEPIGDRTNMWNIMAAAFARAGIDPPTGPRGLYLLRHSAATRMLGQGVSFDTISDVLGHSSVEPTRTYAQVDMSGLRSVALSEEEVRR
jgi:integrase